jgi:type VII secretion integral membrane protein EccD
LRQAGGPALLTGASTALVTLVLVAAGVGGAEPAFLGAGLVTAVLFGAGLLAGPAHLSPAGVAAAAIGLVFLFGPFMPGAAYRLARLPAPNLPSSADEVRGRAATLPGAQLSERSLAADRYLTALLAGASLVIAGGTPFLVAAPGWAPSTVAGAAGVLALLRMRLFTGRAQRIWLLSAALAAATAAVAVAATRTPDGGARSVLAVGVLVLGLVVAGFAVRSPRAASPWRGRLLDVAEIAVAIATIPLVLSVLGVYGYVRSLTG